MKRTKINVILSDDKHDYNACVKGWVRTFRNNQFIALNDGSTIHNLQLVVDFSNTDEIILKRITTGACISAIGNIIPSLGKGQKYEMKVSSLEILGDSDAEKYPLQPKKHSLEFLRDIAHLRFRTSTFSAVFRVRNTLAYAVHKFFQEKGFVYLHTPIITASDAEGAGQMFRVTTLDLNKVPFTSEKISNVCWNYYDTIFDLLKQNNYSDKVTEIDKLLNEYDKELDFKKFIEADLITIDSLIEKGALKNETLNSRLAEIYSYLKQVDFFKRKDFKHGVYLPDWMVHSINPARNGVKAHRIWNFPTLRLCFYNFKFIHNSLRISSDRKTDDSKDFFGKTTNLTVSGQLEAELATMALSEVYTFGPTFRAENSNTARHLAEFWMIEPEVAFNDLDDNMNLAEEMLQYVIKEALTKCADDIAFLNDRLLEEEKQKPQQERSEMSLLDKLKFCIENNFERITYTEAFEILRESNHNKKKKFSYLIDKWGADLQSEHERYLVEKHFKKPVILTDYPKEIKAFYMRQNEDGKTVRAMDVLFPGIGEIIGGSQREERYEKLFQRMKDMRIPTEEMYWYLDTRKFGSCPHAGFGLGFERLVLFVTGMTNIRDVIAFARTPKNCEF
ncbi:MAG: asparagine--tRNA ligase [Bacteroidia bacterium]